MHRLLVAMTVFTYLFILLPILVVVVSAFSPTEFFVFPPPGLSLRWFATFFGTESMRNAFTLSIQLAIVSSILATLVGTMGGLYIARRRGLAASILQGIFLAPLVFPAIVLGLSLLLFFKLLGGMPAFTGLVIAHCVLGMPFVVRSVAASVLAVDPVLEEAAQSLRAGPLRGFALVTLPLIWPGILAGGIFAFILSFGELNAALFLTGPGISTLPIEIFDYLQFSVGQLVIAAASALQIGLILIVVFGLERLVGLARVVRS
ncbi:ABC transporter permease [Bosea sp. BK604]|uniref:ABC transporter permease n=1 Tax=Bosea sp. BK604 TaxID=2512180 RepID=UPI0010472AA0|nr:ABC transporter permease [Bosea sp. BK604]TCR61811.1 putative spermidine/putrescine transport system permease protein [Bosea sp. BK604]